LLLQKSSVAYPIMLLATARHAASSARGQTLIVQVHAACCMDLLRKRTNFNRSSPEHAAAGKEVPLEPSWPRWCATWPRLPLKQRSILTNAAHQPAGPVVPLCPGNLVVLVQSVPILFKACNATQTPCVPTNQTGRLCLGQTTPETGVQRSAVSITWWYNLPPPPPLLSIHPSIT
jgi:hypothetical protein